MSLTAGARLGPYEIVSPLGAGGMGEVYRAKDGRLSRTVAIKILSDESAADADRRERFEREAKAISALDHPNICPLYDVGEHEGTYFLVMPCLEGQTLADRIAKGALPPDQAIRCAIEIATALDAAHRHGIIHRDLKPGNIMLTKTGVKLLDFGLAKLKKAAGPLGDTTMVKGTGIGTLLGTMPYMAPEQIEGREVDARSDIFSLGAVIYEMVTGQRAFKGDSPASVIGAILKDEPAPIKTAQPLAPAALDHLVTTCLAKDPDERWQSAADIARELKWIGQASNSQSTTRLKGNARAWQWATAAAVAVALGALAWPALGTSRTPEADPIRFSVMPPAGGSFVLSRSSIGLVQMALSPDGKRAVVVAAAPNQRPSLWIRTLNDVSLKELANTEEAADPFWSPDSQMVGFFARDRLKTVDVTTGNVRDLCPASTSSRGGSWSRDGVIVFGGDSQGGLSKVSTSTGMVEAATTITETSTSHRWPWFLPDGRHFLYLARGDEQTRGIYAASLDGGEPRRVVESVFNAIYVSGHLLTVKGGTLFAYPFDERGMAVKGDPVMVAEQLGASSTQRAAFSASRNGVLVYTGAVNNLTRLRWYDRSGRPQPGDPQLGNFINFRLSPDGSQLATTRIDSSTNTSDIWLTEVARSAAIRFTLHPMNDMGPVWSPDGTRIAFRSDRSGGNHLFASPSSGAAEDQLIVKRETANPTDWSPDGRYVVFHNTVPSRGLDLGVVQVDDRAPPGFIAQSRFDEYDGRFSPDGRWVAYVSEESGAPAVYVQPFPATGARWPVSPSGGAEPRWRRDGRELYYLAPDRRVMSVTVAATGTTFQVSSPVVLFQTSVPIVGSPYRTYFESDAEGRRFLISETPTGPEDPTALTVVVNWPAGLHRR